MKVAVQPGCEAPRVSAHRPQPQSAQKRPKENFCQVLEREDYPEWDDLIDKFHSLVDRRLGSKASQRIVEVVSQLEDQDDLAELGELLVGPGSL